MDSRPIPIILPQAISSMIQGAPNAVPASTRNPSSQQIAPLDLSRFSSVTTLTTLPSHLATQTNFVPSSRHLSSNPSTHRGFSYNFRESKLSNHVPQILHVRTISRQTKSRSNNRAKNQSHSNLTPVPTSTLISALDESSASRPTPVRFVPTVGSVIPVLDRPVHSGGTAPTSVTFSHYVQTSALGRPASPLQRAALEYDDDMDDESIADETEDANLEDADQFGETLHSQPQMTPDGASNILSSFRTRNVGRAQIRDSHLPPLLPLSLSAELDVEKEDPQEALNSDDNEELKLEESGGAQTVANQLSCDLCAANFSSERLLQKHRRNQHPVRFFVITSIRCTCT